CRQPDGKCSPESFPAAGAGKAAAVLLDDRTADHQAQSQALRSGRGGRAALLEHLEYMRKLDGIDADTGIADPEERVVARLAQGTPFFVARPDRHHPAVLRKLDRVLDQVPEYLLEADRVSIHVVPPGREVQSEFESRRAEVDFTALDDLVDQFVY